MATNVPMTPEQWQRNADTAGGMLKIYERPEPNPLLKHFDAAYVREKLALCQANGYTPGPDCEAVALELLEQVHLCPTCGLPWPKAVPFTKVEDSGQVCGLDCYERTAAHVSD